MVGVKGKTGCYIHKPMSQISKERLSMANKGKNIGKIPWNKGMKGIFHISEETKNKIRINSKVNSNFGMKGKKHSQETKKKMSLSKKGMKSPNFGKKYSIERREEISKRVQAQWNKGIYRTKERGEKIRLAHLREKSHFWKGGISFEPYSLEWNNKLKEEVRKRDNYSCRGCGKSQKDRNFPIHHINYNKKDCNIKNLITLCPSCHSKTQINRDFWRRYYVNFDGSEK